MPLFLPSSALAIGAAVAGGTAGRMLYEGAGPVLEDDSLASANLVLSGVTSPAASWGAAPANQDLPWGAGRFLSDSRFAGELTLSHAALTTTANYLVRLNASGSPVFNSAAGQILKFAIGAVQKWAINSAGSDFSPASDNANDLGLTATRIRRLYAAEYWEGSKMTAPAAPAANKGRLYFEDNGAGKVRLVVLFPSGAAQVIATEP